MRRLGDPALRLENTNDAQAGQDMRRADLRALCYESRARQGFMPGACGGFRGVEGSAVMPDLHGDGARGIFCPGCGEPVQARMIAKSYPAPGGQYRQRYCRTLDCPGFNEGVETLESVVGFERRVLDISDLCKEDIVALKQMIRQMRKLAAMKATFEAIEREHVMRAGV